MTSTQVEIKRAATPPAGLYSADIWHSMRNEMERLFDRFSNSFELPSLGSLTGAEPFWPKTGGDFMPLAVDVSEDGKAYTITAELPGIEEKDIDVGLTEDVLTLKGEKRAEKEEKSKNHYLSERSYGAFQRSFALPADVAADKIDAKFAKGVLTVTLPKNPNAQPASKKIDVKVA